MSGSNIRDKIDSALKFHRKRGAFESSTMTDKKTEIFEETKGLLNEMMDEHMGPKSSNDQPNPWNTPHPKWVAAREKFDALMKEKKELESGGQMRVEWLRDAFYELRKMLEELLPPSQEKAPVVELVVDHKDIEVKDFDPESDELAVGMCPGCGEGYKDAGHDFTRKSIDACVKTQSGV